jgi:hypothetical protein
MMYASNFLLYALVLVSALLTTLPLNGVAIASTEVAPRRRNQLPRLAAACACPLAHNAHVLALEHVRASPGSSNCLAQTPVERFTGVRSWTRP